MTTSTKIIGVSGLQRSGKDTLAEFLIKQGYFGVSLGDIVRQKSRERHKASPDPISVANMTETSNWLRAHQGADVVLRIALEQFKTASKTQEYQGLVLFSIRAPIEADWILAQGGELIWVEASDNTRYQRAMNALRPGENRRSKAEYLGEEKLQWKPQKGTAEVHQMNMSYVKKNSTKVLQNDSISLNEFYALAEQLV